MPTFESPALFIDFSRLPAPAVIEEISYEDLLKVRQDKAVELMPSLARAVRLEQSPTNVILETDAYGEMLVRSRINAAARAVMLPFAVGSDLDVLAAFWNITRAPVDDDIVPRDFLLFPGDWESDDRLRSRCQGAAEAMSMAGTAGSYRFHAMSAVPSLRDASAYAIDDMGGVKVTLMAKGDNPVPSAAQIAKVRARLNQPNIKPLTDVVSVAPVRVKDTELVANVTLYPGPDGSIVKQSILTALTRLLTRVSFLGRDLTRSAIFAALNQEGVMKVDLISPAADIVCKLDECARVTDVAVNIRAERDE
jgi:phage-related baseplate assembly protein